MCKYILLEYIYFEEKTLLIVNCAESLRINVRRAYVEEGLMKII